MGKDYIMPCQLSREPLISTNAPVADMNGILGAKKCQKHAQNAEAHIGMRSVKTNTNSGA